MQFIGENSYLGDDVLHLLPGPSAKRRSDEFTKPVEDLYFGTSTDKIPPEHVGKWMSQKPIVLDWSAPLYGSLNDDLTQRGKTAWSMLTIMSARDPVSFFRPTLNTWWDRFRWELHKKLVQWKVVL